jgi:hypothetical protein
VKNLTENGLIETAKRVDLLYQQAVAYQADKFWSELEEPADSSEYGCDYT